MLSLTQDLAEQADAARHKVRLAASPLRFLVSAMLAGIYVGFGVILMLMAAGPLHAAASPAERLVSGAVFSAALTLVVFAGAELSTSAMMVLTQGAATRAISPQAAVGTLLFTFVGNLLGSMLLAWLVVEAGILDQYKGAALMLKDLLSGKAAEPSPELFFRGILCNMLVCASIWACGRLRSEAGKAIVIFWGILAFATSGFEHVVANMTTFAIGLFSGGGLTTWSDFGRNLLFVGLGNLVGGAVLVGLAYLAVARPAVNANVAPIVEPTAPAPEAPASTHGGSALTSTPEPVPVASGTGDRGPAA